MIESAKFTNVNGSFVDMNTVDNVMPFHDMTTEVDVRYSERSKSQQHGDWPSAQYVGKRVYHFEGAIVEDTSAEYWERRLQLISAVMPRPHLGKKVVGTLELELTGIAEKLSAECSLEGWPELPIGAHGPTVGDMQLHFKSPDPRLYGTERTARFTTPDISGANLGVPFNITFPVVFPAGTVQPADVVITNSGNVETYPRFRIVGYVENPRLTLQRHDGVLLQVAAEGLTLQATDYLDIDFRTRTAVLNGNINVYGYTTLSQWWALEPRVNGVDNIVRYSGTNIQVGSYADIYWRNTYMI